MKINYLFVLAIALLFTLSACTPGDSGSTGTTRMFAGGTSGLEIGFLEGSPPAEVFDLGQYPFDVEVKVENAGEWDVGSGDVRVSLSGIDPTEFSSSEAGFTQSPVEDLPGVQLDSHGNAIPGHVVYVGFPGLSKTGEVTGRVTFPIRADVCYHYGTYANSKLCFKKDMLEIDDAVCNAKEQKVVENSGSPIHVVWLRQEPMGKEKIAFTFKIQSRGLGAISRPYSDCDDNYGNEDEVHVKVNTGDASLNCKGFKDGSATEGFVKLTDGFRIITCDQSTSTNIDFEKLVQIELTFDYKDHVDTTLLVKHAG